MDSSVYQLSASFSNEIGMNIFSYVHQYANKTLLAADTKFTSVIISVHLFSLLSVFFWFGCYWSFECIQVVYLMHCKIAVSLDLDRTLLFCICKLAAFLTFT